MRSAVNDATGRCMIHLRLLVPMIESIRFSNTVRSVNTLEIWKVRPMPSAVRRFSARVEMSRPNSSTRPDVACIVPAMQLNSVVLPAPFGPISARRSPLATASEASSTARRPPNTFESRSTRIAGSLMRPLRGFPRASASRGP